MRGQPVFDSCTYKCTYICEHTYKYICTHRGFSGDFPTRVTPCLNFKTLRMNPLFQSLTPSPLVPLLYPLFYSFNPLLHSFAPLNNPLLSLRAPVRHTVLPYCCGIVQPGLQADHVTMGSRRLANQAAHIFNQPMHSLVTLLPILRWEWKNGLVACEKKEMQIKTSISEGFFLTRKKVQIRKIQAINSFIGKRRWRSRPASANVSF